MRRREARVVTHVGIHSRTSARASYARGLCKGCGVCAGGTKRGAAHMSIDLGEVDALVMLALVCGLAGAAHTGRSRAGEVWRWCGFILLAFEIHAKMCAG